MKSLVLAAVSVLWVMGGLALAQGQDEREHARVRLICETKVLIPGTIAWLALDFEIDDQWHLYWNGVNDSGFAPKLSPTFPPGYKVGELLWPAPKRLVQPGDILDHIYEKQVTLLVPVEVPKEAEPGSIVELKAAVEWLMCHEICLPGEAALTLKLPVGRTGEKPLSGPESSVFAKARDRIPKPMSKEKPPLAISVEHEKVSIQATAAVELAFYPNLDCVQLTNLIKEGKRKGDKLILSIKREAEKSPKLKGVVEVRLPGSESPTLWAVDVDLESVNKSTPGPSKPDSRSRGD